MLARRRRAARVPPKTRFIRTWEMFSWNVKQDLFTRCLLVVMIRATSFRRIAAALQTDRAVRARVDGEIISVYERYRREAASPDATFIDRLCR